MKDFGNIGPAKFAIITFFVYLISFSLSFYIKFLIVNCTNEKRPVVSTTGLQFEYPY